MSRFYLHEDGYFEGGFANCLDHAMHFSKVLVDELKEADRKINNAEEDVLALYDENIKLKKRIAELEAEKKVLEKIISKKMGN